MPLPAPRPGRDADVGSVQLTTHRIGLTALASVLLLLASACFDGFSDTEIVEPHVPETPVEGGGLKVGIPPGAIAGLDPARRRSPAELGVLRLMVRTLLTYPARPAPEGNYLVPDIAASLPQVSKDLLTWTYTLQTKARFGPPISRFVICDDFKAAFERLFASGSEGDEGIAEYFSMIEGADSFVAGEGLDGVHCQDQHTLVFQLNAPVGDFAARTALPATGPIPAAENAARHHERDYGRFLVSTGPFMWKGMQSVDFSDPNPRPPEGSSAGKFMTLTRNPDWAQSSDDVRKAYLDEIRIVTVPEGAHLLDEVSAGDLDVVDRASLARTALIRLQRDADLRPGLSVEPDDSVLFLWMNLTAPPFDDVHVRRAVNYAVNKKAVRRIGGGVVAGDIATHVVPPSMPGSPPAGYAPYATQGDVGDVRSARDEMKLSRYDRDLDGKCDFDVCRNVRLITPASGSYRKQAASLRGDLRKIGVAAKVQVSSQDRISRWYEKPSKKAPLALGTWGKGYVDASSFFTRLARSPAASLPGKRSDRSSLRYPTLADKVRDCRERMGADRARCWARVDEYVMEEVVPWVPLLWGKSVRLYSSDIASVPLPYAQFTGTTAYDQVFLKKDAIERSEPTGTP